MIKVGIIGAGKGGTALLDTFSRIAEVKVVGIVDAREDAPGIALAKKLGIPCPRSIEDLLKNPELEIVIEATGSERVKQIIYEHKQEQTHVADAQVANLMMTLVEGEINLLEKLNKQIMKISEISCTTDQGINQITNGITTLVETQDELNKLVAKATEQVKETDKILKFVQNVTKQTRLLGFNATIEAARAGEHGRGFGVVAEEVKKLAQNSEGFTSQITGILQEVAKEIELIGQKVMELNTISVEQQAAVQEVCAAMHELVQVASVEQK